MRPWMTALSADYTEEPGEFGICDRCNAYAEHIGFQNGEWVCRECERQK